MNMNMLMTVSWKYRPAVIVAAGLAVALLFVTILTTAAAPSVAPIDCHGDCAANELVYTNSPAPVSTPIPPEVITQVVVITTTEVVTETVPVTSTQTVTRTEVVTRAEIISETVELTGTTQGTVVLPVTKIFTETEVVTDTETITMMDSVTKTVEVTATQVVFLDVGIIEGQIWHDLDNNATGLISSGDQSLAGVTVRLSSGDGIFLEATTDASGFYRFENLPLNRAYSIQVDPTTLPDNKKFRPNYDPDDILNSITTVTLSGDMPVIGNQNFSYAAGDYGDLPDSYSTDAPNGAFHATVTDGSQLILGSEADDINVEVTANIDANARGDGQDNGIVKLSPKFIAGEKASFRILVNGAIPAGGAVVGTWFDWNLDGTFTEDEFESFAVVDSESDIQICVPEDYADAPIPARFRLFSSDQIPGGTVDWTDFQGPAVNGEVEDYIFALSTAVSVSQMELTISSPTVLFISLVVLTTLTATVRVNRLLSEQ